MRYHRFAREDVMAEVIPELAHLRPVSGKSGAVKRGTVAAAAERDAA